MNKLSYLLLGTMCLFAGSAYGMEPVDAQEVVAEAVSAGSSREVTPELAQDPSQLTPEEVNRRIRELDARREERRQIEVEAGRERLRREREAQRRAERDPRDVQREEWVQNFERVRAVRERVQEARARRRQQIRNVRNRDVSIVATGYGSSKRVMPPKS